MTIHSAIDSDAEIAKRLMQFRNAMDYGGWGGKTRFAREIGFSFERYHNAEKGIAISKELLRRIIRRWPGATEAWFNRGDPRGLDYETAVKLGLVGKDSTWGS